MADTQQVVDEGQDPNAAPPLPDDEVYTPSEADSAAESEHAASEPNDADEQKQLALSRGWVDDEKGWRGKGKWVDASTFNKRYEEVMPVVTAENRQLRRELREYNNRMAEMQATVEQLTRAQQEQNEARQEITMRTLVAQKAAAESEGDFQKANEIGNQILQLAIDKRIPQGQNSQRAPAQAQIDPRVKQITDEFMADNPVFYDNPELTALLAREAKELQENGYPYRDRRLLDTARESLEAKFPAKLGVQRTRRAAMVEMNGTPRPNATRGRTWADLKPEVQAEQDRFIMSTPDLKKMGVDKARAGILKNLGPQHFRR